MTFTDEQLKELKETRTPLAILITVEKTLLGYRPSIHIKRCDDKAGERLITISSSREFLEAATDAAVCLCFHLEAGTIDNLNCIVV